MTSEQKSNGTGDVGDEIIKIISNERNLTNAEIAQIVDTKVSIVRDIRRNHGENEDEPAEQEGIGERPQKALISDRSQSLSHTLHTSEENIGPEDTIAGGNHPLTSLSDAIVSIEYTGSQPIVSGIDKGFIQTFGYTPREMVGKSLYDYILPESYADRIPHPHNRDTDETPYTKSVTRKTKNGIQEFLCREVQSEEGNDQSVIRSYTEITQRKRREVELERQVKQLKEENTRLENKSQQLEQFASILSHDLRNPINIAQGYVGQIKNKENEQEVAVIERAFNRMEALIQDTLTLKEQSQPVEELDCHSVSELAESAWEVVETGESELRVTDRFDFACDEERVTRLFENLFRNAIDHNEDPVIIRVGIHDTLTTSTRGDTQRAFYVSDDGCGIPKDKRDQVFEIGETTTRDGTGLGLPIIERIAEAHQWNVQVVDSFDVGAKFVFNNVRIE